MREASFYHEGFPVCVQTLTVISEEIDRNQYEIKIIHFSQYPDRMAEAETVGVQSVPELLLNNQVFHISFGTSMLDVKGAV